MTKVLVLKRMYNLSDDDTEGMLYDRQSFKDFCDLGVGDRIPDTKTIWSFQQEFCVEGIDALIVRFSEMMEARNITYSTGSIIDATFTETPIRRATIPSVRRKTAYTKHPQVLLNIFVARHIARRVSRSNTIDFQGQVFQIAPTNHKMVYVVYHHDSKFWVIETEIDTLNPKIPEILACYETQNSTFERPLWKKSISEAYSK